MKNSRQVKYAYTLFLVLFVVLICWYFKILVSYNYLGQDAGYYLKIAYDLSNGLSYYTSFNSVYTPLGIYLYSIPFYCNQSAGLLIFQIGIGVLYSVNALLFFILSKWINPHTKLRVFFTLLMLIMQFKLQGLHILLEPIVLFFLLLSIILLFKAKEKVELYMVSGLCVFLAFFTKQYGVFVVPSMLFYIVLSSENKKEFFKKSTFFLLGLSLPFLVLYAYYYNSFSIGELLGKLLGKTTKESPFIVTAPNYTAEGLVYKLKRVTYMFPYVGLLVLLFFKRTKNYWFLVVLFLCSLTQLYFAYYYHYFQLIIPFLILLLLAIDVKIMRKATVVVLAITTVFTVSSFLEVAKKERKQKAKATHQQEIAAELEKCLPKGEAVYLHGVSPAFYFKSKYNSPNTKSIGYVFPNGVPVTVFEAFLKKGQYMYVKQKDITVAIEEAYNIVCVLQIRKEQICLIQKK